MLETVLFSAFLLASSGGEAPFSAELRPAQSLASPRAELGERLFRALAAASTEAEGRAVEDEVWRFWLDLAPDARIRALVDEAMRRREAWDLAGAQELLDEAVSAAPGFAEAWNQRAFVRFLRDDLDGAEADIHAVLALEPRHFGALSGLFHVLMRQGRSEAAIASLERAVKIHPWLKERSMLPPDPDATRPPIKGREQDL
jgi:tetratricopeptide (TPR) repeat protein